MVKSKFTPEQKIQIVLESIRTSTSTAELCRKHNVHPQMFHNWKQRFMESGKTGLSQSGKKDPIKTMKKRERQNTRGRVHGKIEECRAKTRITDMESRMLCFYYSLVLYNEWIIVRAMLSDGTERQSVMTMLTFKIQVESHLVREPKPLT